MELLALGVKNVRRTTGFAARSIVDDPGFAPGATGSSSDFGTIAVFSRSRSIVMNCSLEEKT
jgi:hypothetical protein